VDPRLPTRTDQHTNIFALTYHGFLENIALRARIHTLEGENVILQEMACLGV